MAKKYFVDTNVFLRLIIDDGGEQHKTAEEIFDKSAQKKGRLFTSHLVFFELYWVLSSNYKKNKREAAAILNNVLRMDFIKIENKMLLEEALEYFKGHNLELEDCYNLFYALNNKGSGLVTFDKKFQKNFEKMKLGA